MDKISSNIFFSFLNLTKKINPKISIYFIGNRTWVMTDFDRHIISVWRPKGSIVIFGDRFIKDKQQLGYSLCFYCGMLEQQLGQFSKYRQRPYCSQKCLNAELAENNNVE